MLQLQINQSIQSMCNAKTDQSAAWKPGQNAGQFDVLNSTSHIGINWITMHIVSPARIL